MARWERKGQKLRRIGIFGDQPAAKQLLIHHLISERVHEYLSIVVVTEPTKVKEKEKFYADISPDILVVGELPIDDESATIVSYFDFHRSTEWRNFTDANKETLIILDDYAANKLDFYGQPSFFRHVILLIRSFRYSCWIVNSPNFKVTYAMDFYFEL